MLSRGRAKAVTAHERRSLLSDGSEEMPTSMLAGLKGLIFFFFADKRNLRRDFTCSCQYLAHREHSNPSL